MLYREQNKLSESAEILEKKLLAAINEVQITILSLLEVELEIGNDKKAEKLSAGLGELVKQFELWDCNALVAPFRIAIKQRKVEESISIIQSMFESIRHPWNPTESTLYNHFHQNWVPLSKDKEMKMERLGMTMLPTLLKDLETNPDYEFLRSNQEFLHLLKKYKKKCENEVES